MGLMTQTELSNLVAPSINKTLQRTVNRKQIMSDQDSALILQSKQGEQHVRRQMRNQSLTQQSASDAFTKQ